MEKNSIFDSAKLLSDAHSLGLDLTDVVLERVSAQLRVLHEAATLCRTVQEAESQ